MKTQVDEDGNNILDAEGNQVINYGLKTEKKKNCKTTSIRIIRPKQIGIITKH